MRYEISPNGNLILFADADEVRELQGRADEEDFGSDNFTYDLLEDMIANSELSWVQPEEIGALTDAPILGIFGSVTSDKSELALRGGRQVGFWDNATQYEPCLKAWGFMDYAVISVQQRLIDTGQAVFQGAWSPAPVTS